MQRSTKVIDINLPYPDNVIWSAYGGQGEFGTADAWRYYNALYYPYVAGLKPYSRRAIHDDLDPAAGQALAWFQAQVPERTLYNWQTAAARLVAQNLREQS